MKAPNSCATCAYGRKAPRPPGPIADISAPQLIECHGTAPTVFPVSDPSGQMGFVTAWPTIAGTQWCALWAALSDVS